MAKLNSPECPDFDGFAMCSSQPIAKVASYEWCRKYLEGLEEVNEKVKIATILQTEEQTYMETLLEKLKIDNRQKILNIDWKSKRLDDVNLDYEKGTELEIIIKGNLEYMERANKMVENIIKDKYENVTIINCYNVEDSKASIADIICKNDMILNTSGMKNKNEYITNIKIANE